MTNDERETTDATNGMDKQSWMKGFEHGVDFLLLSMALGSADADGDNPAQVVAANVMAGLAEEAMHSKEKLLDLANAIGAEDMAVRLSGAARSLSERAVLAGEAEILCREAYDALRAGKPPWKRGGPPRDDLEAIEDGRGPGSIYASTAAAQFIVALANAYHLRQERIGSGAEAPP